MYSTSVGLELTFIRTFTITLKPFAPLICMQHLPHLKDQRLLGRRLGGDVLVTARQFGLVVVLVTGASVGGGDDVVAGATGSS